MFKLKNRLASTVMTPEAGKTTFFPNENGTLSSKNSLGQTNPVGSGGGGITSIQNSNTVYVNLSLASDNITLKIFKTYASALAWIVTNGNPSVLNQWQIIMPAGNVGNVELSNKYIYVACNTKTIIANLTSTVAFSTLDPFIHSIKYATITNIVSTFGTLISCYDCLINNVTSTVGTAGYLFLENCKVVKGTFDYITFTSIIKDCLFTSLNGDISKLSGNLYNCTLVVGAYPITFINDYEIRLNYCKATGNFNLQNVWLLTYFCHFDGNVFLTGNARIFAFNSYFYYVHCSIIGPIAQNVIELKQSFIDILITITSNDVIIYTKGSSYYCQSIGDVTFEDFNNADATNIAKIHLADAIPAGKYISKLLHKVIVPFVSYSGLTILDVKSVRTAGFINVAETVVIDNYSMAHTTDQHVDIHATLSNLNAHDWSSGSINVFAYFKSIPTLS